LVGEPLDLGQGIINLAEVAVCAAVVDEGVDEDCLSQAGPQVAVVIRLTRIGAAGHLELGT
jgi:hypothetical protein